MGDFGANLKNVFAAFDAFDALQIVLFALVFYYVFRILKNNNAIGVIVVFSLLIIATGVLFISDSGLHGDAYMVIPIVFAGLVLVIFNVEVKRDIMNMNTLGLTEKPGHQPSATKDEVERYISDIIRALQNLSKDNIGASFRSRRMRTFPKNSARATARGSALRKRAT